ncbi:MULTISPECIES: site-2 protease family protein [unclassified Methanoregula]|uniref:site-2 protease family protein n=1 Tax=unclassified Methanoregula TaxID=2649730 RepID=UPI0009D09E9A|nr:MULTISPECIES: site-2 protease family protein [unclassified Methanoregula]OPX64682.1 MAG: Peptidase family M50 [Methanoregula sp. PtaB.Bin085]OPY36050.1 MAG: Peptidase family M50 [Methanoregula sp. PtaU1.Bin006]
MDWIPLIILLVIAYAFVAYYIHKNKLWPEYITFYGPFMAIKTEKVAFFDRAIPYSTFLRAYGTLGVVTVVIVSVLMTIMLFYSVQYIVTQRPPLTAANELRNVLAIPGVNDFIPFTFAVWFGLIATMAVHEFGHAVLCRVEGIRVKSTGILLAVIPIGAFVEPDEEDQEKTKGLAKMRMFGAGITNNILLGMICFALVVFMLGFAVPVQTPFINSVYLDAPAHAAGVEPFSVVKEVNGVPVSTRDDVSALLNSSKPGDQITLLVDHRGTTSLHTLTLTAWPKELGERTNGFMGVTYYDAVIAKQQFELFREPVGLIILLAIPIYTITEPASFSQFSLLIIDSAEAVTWQVPFPEYWTVVQVLFWCGWFNLVVGTFNALPLVPLDGGYILREGVDRIMDRQGLLKYAAYVSGAVSSLMLAVLVAVVVLPLVLNAPK